MSKDRERRKRQWLAAIVLGNEKLAMCVGLIAEKLRRQLATEADYVAFVWELWTRKILVDEGPLPNKQRHFSVRFERLGKEAEISIEDYLEARHRRHQQN